MTVEIKKTRTITRTAELTLSHEDIEEAILEAVRRDHKELKDYRFDIAWNNDGGAVVTGTSSNGSEA